jgi:Tol biopolymer transport system component
MNQNEMCTVTVHSGETAAPPVVAEYAACSWSTWAPDRTRFAYVAISTNNRTQIVVVEGETPSTRIVYNADALRNNVATIEWDGERLIAGVHGEGGGTIVSLADGAESTIAELPSAPPYLYPSPDRSRFLFTQSAPDGWELWMLGLGSDAVTKLGRMGSDAAAATPPEQFDPNGAAKVSPMYIAWSPDGARVAFGGGYEAPYFMTTVDLTTGTAVRTDFPNGYPGEIRWTADSTRIAVSTYDVERTHHETWVIEPSTGEGRHLMNGCVIVWSPDGRFLAVHAEDVPGISIVDVDTGARGQLTHRRDDAPIEWSE